MQDKADKPGSRHSPAGAPPEFSRLRWAHRSKWLLIAVCTALQLLFWSLSCAGASDMERHHTRLPAPAFTLSTLQGQTVHLHDYHGKLVLLNFWATWCPPCREEMPSLQSLWQDFKNRDFIILAVAADRGNKKGVARFTARLGLEFPILLDPDGQVRKRYEVFGLPLTYLIGKDGKILGRFTAAQAWDSTAIKDQLRTFLQD